MDTSKGATMKSKGKTIADALRNQPAGQWPTRCQCDEHICDHFTTRAHGLCEHCEAFDHSPARRPEL